MIQLTEAQLFEQVGRLYMENQVLREALDLSQRQAEAAGENPATATREKQGSD